MRKNIISILLLSTITIFSFPAFCADVTVSASAQDKAQLDAEYRQEIRKAKALLNRHLFADYKKQVMQIREKYKFAANDVELLIQMVTYAQLVDHEDPKEARNIFFEIIEMDPMTITVPERGQATKQNRAYYEGWVEFLKRGTVWGALNNRTSAIYNMKDRGPRDEQIKKIVSDFIKEMSATEEGKRCIAYAESWQICTLAKGEVNMEQMPQAKSFLPPEEKPLQVAAAPKSLTPEAKPVSVQKNNIPAPVPSVNKYGDAKILGEKTIALEEKATENNYSLYLALALAGIGILCILYGLLYTNAKQADK